MEGKFSQEKTNASSTNTALFADPNIPSQEEFAVKKEDTEMTPVMDAVQLNLERDKTRIREEIIAHEILRRKNLEAEVRMELMVEKQLMGFKSFDGVSSLDHCMSMKSGFLGSQIRPSFDGNLVALGVSGDKLSERMNLISHPVSGVGELLQNNPNLHENNVLGCEEKQQIQDMVLGRWPFERDPSSTAAQLARKSMAELSGEQVLSESQAKPSSGTPGVKRKADALAIGSDEETASAAVKDTQMKWYCSLCGVSATSEGTLNTHYQGKKHKAKEAKSQSVDAASTMSIDCSIETSVQLTEQEKTPVTNKWHCSLCQVSASSEMNLRSHLQGKKHKSKEAKLGLDQNINNMEVCATEKSQEAVEPAGKADVGSETIKKWYCSLCQVSAVSEKNLNDHFQGKKHKAKEETSRQETDNVESKSAAKVSELGETTREKNLEGSKSPKSKQDAESTIPNPGNHQGNELETTNKSGQQKIELETVMSSSLHRTSEDMKYDQIKENEQESLLRASPDTEKVENSGYLSKENVKYWHCQICNEETCDEGAMAVHRKSKKHTSLLHKNGGGVIVVSRMSKDVKVHGKGTQ